MALKTKKGSELPEGALRLSREEALAHQWAFIKSWPSELEVVSLKFGRHIVSASTFLSSSYIFNFLKNIFNVSNARFVVAVFPGVVVPSFFSYMITDKFTTEPSLLMKYSCPICDQLKLAVCQFYLSLIFPTTYGFLSLSTFAILSKSYPIPDFRSNAREYWKAAFKILKLGSTRLQVVGLAQTVLILFLPYFQNKQLLNVMTKYEQQMNKINNNEMNIQLDSAF